MAKDPVTSLFDLLAGYDGPNKEHRCERCGMRYYVVGGRYDPPYDRFCGSRCATEGGAGNG